MEKIQHKNLHVNGIKMHIAEIGEGHPILFLHGFPELWYSWRHQLLSLSSRGFRAIAPDLRGYGDTEVSPSVSSYCVFHIIGDLVALLDLLKIDKVFLVGHDWGSYISWWFCKLRPERIRALVSLSVVHSPRNPNIKPSQSLRAAFGDDHYICKFQEPGLAEEVFAHVDPGFIIKKFRMHKDGLVCNPEERIILPSWLSEEDVDYYASKFKQTGFTGGLNYYRAMDLNWEMTASLTGVQVKVPVKLIVGDLDITYNTPGVKEYIQGGGLKRDEPFVTEILIMEGVAHFLQEERPEEITGHIYHFIKKFI